MDVLRIVMFQLCVICSFPQYAVLGKDASSICRFGDVKAGCALPCDKCIGACDKTTGECLGQCEDGPPQGYPWHGPGCRIGNVALGKTTGHNGKNAFTSGNIFGGDLLVDGDVRNKFINYSCALIDYKKAVEKRAWIYIDLEGVYKVNNVSLVNRKYTTEELKKDDYYKRGGAMRLGASNTTNIPATPSCINFNTWLEDGETRSLDLTCTEEGGSNFGRYFYIQRMNGSFHQETFSLCEVILDAYEVIDCSSCPGDCNDLTGCTDCGPGVKYPDCKINCTSGSWSQNCEQNCSVHCHQEGEICDIRNGTCVRCEDKQLTSDWYTGEKCDVIIKAGSTRVDGLRIESVTQHSMIATWALAVDKRIRSFYAFRWILSTDNSTDRNETIDFNDGEQRVTLTNLTADTNYTVDVYVLRVAENNSQYLIPGSNQSYSTLTLMNPPPRSTYGPPMNTAGIVVGCVIIVIVILLVTAILYVILSNRKQVPAKSVHAGKELPTIKSSAGMKRQYENVELKTAANGHSQKKKHTSNLLQRATSQHHTGEQHHGVEDMTGSTEADVTEVLTDAREETLYANLEDIGSPTRVKMEDLYNYINNKLENDDLKNEYQGLPDGLLKKCSVAQKHRALNRYKNILPYDQNRIRLDCDRKIDTDFINASHMRGYKNKLGAYVACQGPKPETTEDMWRMLWQLDVKLVAMVTGLIEGAKVKCHQYWPGGIGNKVRYGMIEVTQVKEDVLAYYTVRTLEMAKHEETRTITHYQFTGWPDKTIPSHTLSLLEFLAKINTHKESLVTASPVVIHCSAGIGRTGTLIAIDILMKQAEAEGSIDVFSLVCSMRLDRAHMVQNQDQYLFIYCAVLEWHERGDSAISVTDFPLSYQEMFKQEEIYSNVSKVVEEKFENLCSLKPRLNSDVEQQTSWEGYSRDPDIYPVESSRVRLYSDHDGSPVYINAVYVPTYRSDKGLVVTQAPLSNMLEEFWHLVFFIKPTAIIMLQDMDDGEEPYWPQGEEDADETFGSIMVNLCGTEHAKIDKRSFVISNTNRRDGQLRVQHLHMKDWNSDLPSPENLLNLVQKVEKLGQESETKEPVLVHCRNGSARCGVFAAAVLLLEKIKTEGVVDVISAVCSVAASRPQFINTKEEFGFLHEFALVAIRFLEANH